MYTRRKALLVATDTYSDRLFRELRGPGADVEALATLLADPAIGGYSVEVLHNQPAHAVSLAINGLFADARRDDLVLLYVSGHGVKDDAGQLYLAATNSRHDRLEATTVAAQFVRDQMTRSRSGYITVWLDCCYAGAFPPGAMHRSMAQGVDVLPRLSGRGRAVMTASSALEYAYETGTEPDLMPTGTRKASRGVFTDALIKGLATGEADLDGDGLIDVDELYRYVYDQVEASPYQQTPRLDSQIAGKLCVATSVRGPRTTFGLSSEVVQALNSPLPKVRLAVLDDAVAIASSGNAATRNQVRIALTNLTTDKDSEVADAVRKRLQHLDVTDLTVDEPRRPSSHLPVFLRTLRQQIRLIANCRIKPMIAALTLTVIFAASVLVADRPSGTNSNLAGPSASSPPRSATPPSNTSQSVNSSRRIPAATNLTFMFAVDPIPGYRIGDSRFGESAQSIEIREVTGDPQEATRLAAWVSVYQAGAFDPHEAQAGEPVAIAGNSGFYNPTLSEYNPVEVLHKPGLAVEYAPGSWYVVQTDDQLPKARDTVLKVAAAVRFGVNRSARFPIRLGYLPAGLHPCGGRDGLDPARIGSEPWSGEIDLCDDLYGRADNSTPSAGEAVRIHMDSDPGRERPPRSNKIGGRPAQIDNNTAWVDCSGFVLQIDVQPSHASRYNPLELQKIIESLTVRSMQNKSSWFNGMDSLPKTS